MIDDETFVRLADVGMYPPDNEPAGSDPNYVKHIHCEGARFHVISWDSHGERCSHPNCIINKYREERLKNKSLVDFMAWSF